MAVTFAVHGDLSAVQLHQMPRDGQAEAEAAVPARGAGVLLAEPVEDVRQELGRDADAGVLDDHQHRGRLTRRSDHDLATRRGELDGIGQQVPHDLLQARSVAGNGPDRRLDGDRQPHSLGVGGHAHGLHGALNQVPNRDRLDFQPQGPSHAA